jgi:hypothetical protein
MRPILLICALLAVLTPAAAAAPASTSAKHGYLVVRKAAGDGGVSGRPVATVIVKGFVLGSVFREGKVDIIQLPSVNGQGAPQVTPPAATRSIRWHAHGGHVFTGKEFSGSNFRFRALGGSYRVVVRGSGIYLFAGGRGTVTLRGSSVYKNADGKYSVNGGRFRSLPAKPITRTIGGG